jgi:hypothetical protein
MAYWYANTENLLHGITFKGRLAYAMRAGSAGTARFAIWPAYLKQAGGRPEPRIEQFVEPMFLEDGHRDDPGNLRQRRGSTTPTYGEIRSRSCQGAAFRILV